MLGVGRWVKVETLLLHYVRGEGGGIAYPEVRVRIPYPSTYPYLSTGTEKVRGTGEC